MPSVQFFFGQVCMFLEYLSLSSMQIFLEKIKHQQNGRFLMSFWGQSLFLFVQESLLGRNEVVFEYKL